MSDPTYSPQDYIQAHDILDHLQENLAIQFQIEGETWERETMQKHVTDRAAMIHVLNLLLDAAVRAADATKPKP